MVLISKPEGIKTEVLRQHSVQQQQKWKIDGRINGGHTERLKEYNRELLDEKKNRQKKKMRNRWSKK